MSRLSIPSQTQVEKLLECLEEQRFLATGHARTAHARDRTRAAWENVALKLNSDAGGCTKQWQQWAKYWKDKKAAVKRKVSQIRISRLQTGGGVGETLVLSTIEERIVSLMGGEGFAIGDRELEINPFHPATDAQVIDVSTVETVDPPPVEESFILSIQQDNVEQGSGSILQGLEPSVILGSSSVHIMQSQQPSPIIPQPLPGPSTRRDDVVVNTTPIVEQRIEPMSPQPAVPHRSSQMASLTPRRRRLARRRILPRSPPSQRQSQVASLSERFIAIEETRIENETRLIAIEERRVENERLLTERSMAMEEKRLENERQTLNNQRQMFDIFMEVSSTLSKQFEAMQELCSATKSLAERRGD